MTNKTQAIFGEINMKKQDIENIRKAELILKGWEDETVSYSNKQVQAYIKAVDDWSDKLVKAKKIYTLREDMELANIRANFLNSYMDTTSTRESGNN